MRRGHLIGGWVLGIGLAAASSFAAGGDGPKTLTAESPSLAWWVPCLDRSAGDRFVQVDIAEVDNPRSVELAFQVHYQRDGSEAVYLGSFALFPPDRPGRFIVPTRGEVGPAGRILLSLEPLPGGEEAAAVRVAVGGIRLTDGRKPREDGAS